MTRIFAAPSLVAAIVLGTSACVPGPGVARNLSPNSGIDVLRAMHDRYEGKWFKTLTFKQATTVTRPDGTTNVTTWYEAVRSPRLLRIDFGEPSAGNGVLYTPDSVIAIRAGKVVRARAEGNPFLPFVVGVYTQPLDTTIAQLAPWKFDLSKLSRATFEGRAVYVVGADSGSDTTPQFWVDIDRLILVRMIVPLGTTSPYDIRLLNYRKLGDSWVAMHISMLQNGKEVQAEDYTDARIDTPLAPDFFAPEKWTTAPHWHTSAPGSSQ
jgi:hypothetical protein